MNNLRKLGIEKTKVIDKNFDDIYEKYKEKAKELGLHGELKFIREKGKVLIYATI